VGGRSGAKATIRWPRVFRMFSGHRVGSLWKRVSSTQATSLTTPKEAGMDLEQAADMSSKQKQKQK
jgi:hypothetical protein